MAVLQEFSHHIVARLIPERVIFALLRDMSEPQMEQAVADYILPFSDRCGAPGVEVDACGTGDICPVLS